MGETGQNKVMSGSGSNLTCGARYGYALVESPRPKLMEDRLVAAFRKHGSDSVGLFAVFDGHGGTYVSRFLKKHISEEVLASPELDDNPASALSNSFMQIDKRVLAEDDVSGSTATVALIMEAGSRLVVASVGDSRSVLSRGGKAVDVTIDHNPALPEELKKVTEKGGVVTRTPGGVPRVDGVLAMSRAVGDKLLKRHLEVTPDTVDRGLGPDDNFLILASDGVWHVLSSQDAVDLVRPIQDPEVAARRLVKRAAEKGSKDDISAIVVALGMRLGSAS